jgi:hypothetical protein
MTEPGPLRDYSRSRAVLIGAWDYNYLTKVPAACHSLKRMEGLLVGPLCGWPATRVEVVSNTDQRGDLPGRLMRLFEGITDVALFYFVGHGQLHDDELCLALTESPNGGPSRKTTGLPFSDVRAALRECEAKTKIVILDCCFSGIATREHTLDAAATDVTDMVVGAGEFTMAASATYRTAWFETGSGVDRPQTYFTRYLIDTIEQGLPGYPDGLPLGAVFTATAEALVRDKRPVPTRSVWHHADLFILARNPRLEQGELPKQDELPGPHSPHPPKPAGLAAAAVIALAAVAALIAVILIAPQRHPDSGPPRAAPPTSEPARTPAPHPAASRSKNINHLPDSPVSPAPARSPSPSPPPSAYRISGLAAADDQRTITASVVSIGFGVCSAWLDNDGSGKVSGVLKTSYYASCDAEVYRSGGPAVSLAATAGAERTSALSDIGHTMWICVWPQYYQAGRQCSSPFGIADSTPAQK